MKKNCQGTSVNASHKPGSFFKHHLHRKEKKTLIMPYLYSKERKKILVFLVHLTFLSSFSEASINLTVSPSGPVEVNQSVTLQCTFENKTKTALFYSTASNEPFCDLTSGSSGGNCISAGTLCSSYFTATCPNNRTYSVVYPALQRWNGKGVYCRGLISGNERSNQVNFSVIVSVTLVTLSPNQITVDAGKQITLTCQTDYCNPAANITWYKASINLATPTTDTTDIDSNGLIRTTSVLQYTGVAGENGQQVYCIASNRPGNRVESNKYILQLRYPPSFDPVILAYPPGIQYNTGTTVNLTCKLSGGNPVATLSWRCKNTVMTGTNQGTSTTAVSVLSLVMDSSYNNQQCTCTANHSLLASPKSRNVSLTVFYPPSTDPVITASPPGLHYNTGTTVTLTCQLSGGNPLATLSWRCKNIPMTGTNQSTSTTAVSVLSLVMDSSYNNQQCTCTTNHSLLTSPKSRNVSLTVFYPPSSDSVITASPPGLLYNTGTKVTLTCQLSGGNPLAMLSWRCKNTVMTGTSQSNSTTAVSVLSLVMDSSYNNQQCTCTANHNLFTSPKSTSASLNVFYNNIITSNWNQTYSIKEHENFHLDCEVDGNPLSNITWMLVKNSTVLKKNYRVKKSSLEITSAACLDYGTYKVLADNGKGSRASKTAKLIVKCKPRLYMTDSITPVRIGVGNNDPLQIFVRILLFPPAIQTTWYFSGKTNENKIIRNSIDGYRIKHRNGDVEQNITLYKESVNIEDFGHYTLRVENEIGVFTMIFYAISTSVQVPGSNSGGIVGGTIGGVVFLIVLALITIVIFINRKYQIKFVERNSNSSGGKTEVSDKISETQSLRAEMSVQYEELKKTNLDQENSYDVIRSQNKNRASGAVYEDLQPQKEEKKYEGFTVPKGEKKTTYTSPENVYVNTSFSGN